ncbi:MAG: Wzz/FepE/Etk N-terminal domain-containing protein [Chloroflexi bacterium]|nr:Wzz/FepE/Etk N-terminal domain-containing protein [Chloroflexota bacterium]
MYYPDITAALARRWYIILAFLVVCTGTAGVYSKLTTKFYRASVVISVTAARFDNGNELAAQALLANYAIQMTSDNLLTALNTRLQLDTPPRALAAMVHAIPDNMTLTITLQVDDTNAQRAADIANGLSTLFVSYIRRVNQAQLNPDVDLSIVRSAATPTEPNRPKLKINILVSTLGGLAVGSAAIYLLEIWDDRLHTERDITRGVALPVLANISPMNIHRVALPHGPHGDVDEHASHFGAGSRRS